MKQKILFGAVTCAYLRAATSQVRAQTPPVLPQITEDVGPIARDTSEITSRWCNVKYDQTRAGGTATISSQKACQEDWNVLAAFADGELRPGPNPSIDPTGAGQKFFRRLASNNLRDTGLIPCPAPTRSAKDDTPALAPENLHC